MPPNLLRFTGPVPAGARGCEPAALLETAVAAARTAGRHAARRRGTAPTVARTLAHDVKLQLDLECQERAARVIRRRYPAHRLCGEEDTPALATGDPSCPYVWIIDPIDGTVNFAHGLPHWCCSVAVGCRGRILAGAVYAAATGDLFTAHVRAPALHNGKPLAASHTGILADALVLTGLNKAWNLENPQPLEPFRRLSAAVQKTRILGSAALDICRVAAGHADAFYECGIFAWDVAAAGLIVVRAGGRVAVAAAGADDPLAFLASNTRLFQPLKRLVRLSGAT